MHDLSVIKSAALYALDGDNDESKEGRMAEFLSIVGPLTALEMAAEIERRPKLEEYEEAIQLLRELAEFVEQQPGEEARVLAMRAKVLL